MLVLGQDPAAHEAIARRALVGVAGQRVQGLLAKVGVKSSYVMVNVYLYSVFNQTAANRHIADEDVTAYRHRWLNALLVGTDVSAVLALGSLAERAYRAWARTQRPTADALHLAAIRHPTYAEGVTRATGQPIEETTAAQLADWNDHLSGLAAHVTPDVPTLPVPYAATWGLTDLVPIPEADLPAGAPTWWRAVEPWAVREGPTTQEKRATIKVAVPEGARRWPAL